jgi:hypothetical protein
VCLSNGDVFRGPWGRLQTLDPRAVKRAVITPVISAHTRERVLPRRVVIRNYLLYPTESETRPPLT